MQSHEHSHNNSEPFDALASASHIMWSSARYDFKIIAELLEKIIDIQSVIALLHTVTTHLKNPNDEIFFDGTVKSIKFLVKNKYLNLNDLPTHINEEKILISILKKYQKKVFLNDIFREIKDPILRITLLEYPNLLKTFIQEPLKEALIREALVENGIKDEKTSQEASSDGIENIEMDPDKNSIQAIKCKIIYIKLHLMQRDMQLLDQEMNDAFDDMSLNTIESKNCKKGIFNATYATYYGRDPWNINKAYQLTGCELLLFHHQLLPYPDTPIYNLYHSLLKDETEKIVAKYFPDLYSKNDHIALPAVEMAMMVVLFRTSNFIPDGELKDINIYSKITMLESFDYAMHNIIIDGKKSLILKEWFLHYYREELDKRVIFIKYQIENRIGIYTSLEKKRVLYLPVFESFRFFCDNLSEGFLPDIIRLFHNQNIDTLVKDEILSSFTLNTQKILATKNTDEQQNRMKDSFMLLIIEIFKPLVKKTIRAHKSTVKKSHYDKDDVLGDSDVIILEMIANFDMSKNNSFLGYMKSTIYHKLSTEIRAKKPDKVNKLEKDLDENYFSNLADTEDILEKITDKNAMEQVSKYLKTLSPKQQEAIQKAFHTNKRLTEAERKNKNRGLNKIRAMINP